MKQNILKYKHEILGEIERVFRELYRKGAPVFVGVDENGAYQYSKENISWEATDIVCLRPLPENFQIPREVLEILLGEMASPEEITKLLPLETLPLYELHTTNPELHGRLLEEIYQMTCDGAAGDFEELINVHSRRLGVTLRNLGDIVMTSEDEEKRLSLLLTFLFQENYLVKEVSLEEVTLDTPLSEICRITPGGEEYSKWSARLQGVASRSPVIEKAPHVEEMIPERIEGIAEEHYDDGD